MEKLLSAQKNYFNSGVTRTYDFRIKMLKKLKDSIVKHEAEIFSALKLDLNKGELETYTTEIGILYEEINFVIKRLARFMRPKKVKTALTHMGSSSKIIYEPFGVCLIIAPWNYPFQLALSPLVGAIAAGNTAVIKPSELTPNVSRLINKLISESFPEEYITVVEGAVDVSTELLKQPFDKIFFTGSVPVGKIVMEAAAKHLTPITLELGGKSPCIVHKDADLNLAAKRIVFGKFTNAGQTCVAPDYLYIHKDIKETFLEKVKTVIKDFYSSNPIENKDYVRIVSKRHFDRLTQFLHDGDIIIGGDTKEELLKIEPTVITNVNWDMPIMSDEIFGPLLPILEFDDIKEIVATIVTKPKPLALYLFTSDKEVEAFVTERISYGGGCINDTLMHVATPYLPFGGVGPSGLGSYHGEHSFLCFSHAKSVLMQTNLFDMSIKYPNYKNGLNVVRKFMKP
ncbi:MAG: aldehyde dehydrogenase [Bacillales bacterium]|jgi:aldehyde dehydrogenase (NAD+)|nr:aldehyde dehydrogenase [Bacillales bacterium]